MKYQFEMIDEIKSCFDCPCSDWEHRECCVECRNVPYDLFLDDKPEWCPLVEVKEGE